MSVFNYFTKEQRERARNTDLVQFLRSRGEKLKRSGSEFEWRDGSEKVTVRGNLWFNQYDQKGGDAIDFVRRYYHKDYPEAVAFLLNQGCGQIIHSFSAEEKPKVLEPPKPNSDMRRAYAYLLLNRCIDRKVLNAFIHNKMIYEDEEYHNAVFVGYDPTGKPRHYHKRGTLSESSFKGNVSGSVPEYSFHWHGKSDKIFLFEAPIDMLSFISMHKNNWQQHSYAAACSVSDLVLFQCMKDIGNIDKVFLCMDNDSAGQSANSRIAAKLEERGVEYEILVPTMKDWNEDLTSGCGAVQLDADTQESEEELCPALSL